MNETYCSDCGRMVWLVSDVLVHWNGNPDCASLEAPDNSEVDR